MPSTDQPAYRRRQVTVIHIVPEMTATCLLAHRAADQGRDTGTAQVASQELGMIWKIS